MRSTYSTLLRVNAIRMRPLARGSGRVGRDIKVWRMIGRARVNPNGRVGPGRAERDSVAHDRGSSFEPEQAGRAEGWE